jgi:hypothetical protein
LEILSSEVSDASMFPRSTSPMKQLLRGEALKVFKEWRDKPDKVRY